MARRLDRHEEAVLVAVAQGVPMDAVSLAEARKICRAVGVRPKRNGLAESATEALVASHMPALRQQAAKYNADRLDDLTQAAVLGLLESIPHYDPDRGARLLTYAYRRIRASIRSAHMANEYPCQISREVFSSIWTKDETGEPLTLDEQSAQELGSAADIAPMHEVLADLDDPLDEVLEALCDLPPAQRRAVIVTYLHSDGSYAVAARELDLDRSTVRRAAERGVTALRQSMRDAAEAA